MSKELFSPPDECQSGQRRARYQPDRMFMGQLRTANNRRNRAVRNMIGRTSAAIETLTTDLPVASTAKAKSKRTAS
jgi:hypothetical protein